MVEERPEVEGIDMDGIDMEDIDMVEDMTTNVEVVER
jgi:hypothetical protein